MPATATATATPAADLEKSFDRNFLKNARNPGLPTTDILDQVKAAMKGKGKDSMIFRIVITREIAWDLLILNRKNRPLKIAKVKHWVTIMKKGEWHYTPDSVIGIDTDGDLFAGQHRLWAIYKSGAKCEFDIKTGYPPDTARYIDQGHNRSGGDAFAVEGFEDPHKVAAMASFVMHLKQKNIVLGGRNKYFSYEELLEWCEDEKNKKRVLEYVALANTLNKECPFLSHQLYAGMLFILGELRRTDAEEFMTRLAYGNDLSTTNNSPIYYLRKVLEKWDKKDYPKSRSSEMKVAYIITAWNAYLERDARGRPSVMTSLKLERNYDSLPKPRRS